jgi:uncharacterized phiE125 gp8 family phage protein
MSLKLITAATALPVTLAEAKLAHRFDAADLDHDIIAMIADATCLAEHEIGQCLMSQTWELTLPSFPAAIRLTRPPVASIVSVTYIDTAGVLQTLDPAAYVLDATDSYGPAYLLPVYGTSWPATREQHNAVTVRYCAGYPDADSVPSYLKRQVKIFVAMLLDDPVQMSDRLGAINKVWAA